MTSFSRSWTRADAARTLGVTEGWLRKLEGDILPDFDWGTRSIEDLIDRIIGRKAGGKPGEKRRKAGGNNEEFYHWYVAVAEGVQILREKHGWKRSKLAGFISAVQEIKRREFYQKGVEEGMQEVRTEWNETADAKDRIEFLKKFEEMKREQLETIRHAADRK